MAFCSGNEGGVESGGGDDGNGGGAKEGEADGVAKSEGDGFSGSKESGIGIGAVGVRGEKESLATDERRRVGRPFA